MKKYRAFISYCHGDKTCARRLHKWLETYRVPGGIAPDKRPGRLGRFFRDDEDIAATGDLGETVRGALEESDALIVVCSPRAARSRWVDAEIRHFHAIHGGRRIFPFIVEGSAASSSGTEECFPPFLRSVRTAGAVAAMPSEPLGIDVRADGWKRGCLRLTAGLLGVGFDELWRRNRRRQVFRGAVFSACGVVLATAFGALASIAMRNQSEANLRRAEVSVEKATAASEAGDYLSAMQLAAEALRTADEGSGNLFPRTHELTRFIAALEHAYTHNLTQKLMSHDEPILQVAMSSDGAHMGAAAGATVKLWTASMPKPAVLDGYDTRVTSIAFSPDGSLLAIADVTSVSLRRMPDLDIVWSTAFGAVDSLTPVNANPTNVQFSADGSLLLAFSNSDATLWRMETGFPVVQTLRAPGNISRAGMSVNSGAVLFRLSGGDGIILAVETGDTESVSVGKTTALGLAAVSTSGTVITSENSILSFWELDADEPYASVDTRAGAITALAFSPDDRFFAVGSSEGSLQLWTVGASQPISTFVGHQSRVSSIAFSADGEQLLSGASDGNIRLWRARPSAPIRSMNNEGGRVLDATFSADGRKALAGSFDGSVHVWSVEDGSLAAAVRMPVVDRFLPDVASLPQEMQDISLAEALEVMHQEMPGLSRVFTDLLKSLPGTMTLREMAGILELIPQEASPQPVMVVAIAPDGRSMLTSSLDEVARLWPVSGGEPLRTVVSDDRNVSSASFTPRGNAMVTTSIGDPAGGADLRDLSGEILASFVGHERSPMSSAVSPDGLWVATGSQDKTARLWRIEGGEAVQVFSGPEDTINDVEFSPDGRAVLAASQDGSVWLWEIGQAAPIQTWRVSQQPVRRAAFLPDGELFVTASGDGFVRLWRVGASFPVQTLREWSSLRVADVSPDGQLVLTGAEDGYADLWRIDPIVLASIDEKLRLACQRLTSVGVMALTTAERRRHGLQEGGPSGACE